MIGRSLVVRITRCNGSRLRQCTRRNLSQKNYRITVVVNARLIGEQICQSVADFCNEAKRQKLELWLSAVRSSDQRLSELVMTCDTFCNHFTYEISVLHGLTTNVGFGAAAMIAQACSAFRCTGSLFGSWRHLCFLVECGCRYAV